MVANTIETLYNALPVVFQIRVLPPNWHEDFIFVPIADVEQRIFPQDESIVHREPSEEDLFSQIGERLVEPGTNIPIMSPVIWQTLGGNHGGSPTPYDGNGHPPADCLAFYLPFHRYHPDWWGIYLLYEGIIWLAGELMRRSGKTINKHDAFYAARLALYYHEAFHHKTESFATRLEVTHRQAFYCFGFEHQYQSTKGTDLCLEEGLAEANSIRSVWKKTKDHEIRSTLSKSVADGLPGYRLGVDYCKDRDFDEMTCLFAEENHNRCLPNITPKNEQVWNASPHLFGGIANIKSRINYVIPRNSPIIARMPFRPCLPPNRVVKKLQQLAGIIFVREGKGHQVWKTPQGNTIAIPRHPRDLGRGLLRSIIRQAGLSLSLEEFLES